DSNLRITFIAFGPAVYDLDVANAEQCRSLKNKAGFLAVTVDEPELLLWKADGKRNAGQAGAGADIGNRTGIDERRQREAVQDVQIQNVLDTANAAQVVGLVPFVQLLEVAQ